MIVVLDTNVLVSALISPFGPPARVLDLVLAGELRAAFDDRIFTEYREVLARPRFGFDPTDVSSLLEFLQGEGVSVNATPLAVTLPDPDDLPFLEVAATVVGILVAGNRVHYPKNLVGDVQVLAPAEFLAWWNTQGGQARA